MERVLVLGGSYFIGRHTVQSLVDAGFDVTVLNRGTRNEGLPDGVHKICCDRNDSAALAQALREQPFTHIVDISGLNGRQMTALLTALNCSSVQRLLFLSSSAVYDIDRCPSPVPEDGPLGVHPYWGAYGTDKLAAEQALRQFWQAQGRSFRVSVLRPPYVYGPYNYAYREAYVFSQALAGKPVLLPNNGDTLVQFILASDLAAIIAGLLSSPATSEFAVFNVGNHTPISFRDWATLCAQTAQATPTLIPVPYEKLGLRSRDFFPFHDYQNVLLVDQIKTLFPEETDLQEGLHQAFQWYKQHPDHAVPKPQMLQTQRDLLALWARGAL